MGKKRRGEIIPTVVESSPRGDRVYDVFSRLLKDRVVFVFEEINEFTATTIVAQLLLLESEDPNSEVSMYIMSPGGDLNAAMAIYDTMQYVSCTVATYCMGLAASSAAFLLASGEKGRRFVLPSSRVMIHQPWGSHEGDATNLRLQCDEMDAVRIMLYKRMAKHTGRSVRQVEQDCERDNYMGAQEAVKYGIVDRVLKKRPKRRSQDSST